MLEEEVCTAMLKDLLPGRRRPIWLELLARRFLQDHRLLLRLMRGSKKSSMAILTTNQLREMTET
jgi:hypothetical protein